MNDPDIASPNELSFETDSLSLGVWPNPCLGYVAGQAALIRQGEASFPSVTALREIWGSQPLIVVNAPLLRQRLFGDRPHRSAAHLDVLELFAFVSPARFCAPSLAGLAQALGLEPGAEPESQAACLSQCVERLILRLSGGDMPFRLFALSGLKAMQAASWPWSDIVAKALDRTEIPPGYVIPDALSVFSLLEEWEDQAPRGQARGVSLSETEVEQRLKAALARAGLSETRPEQKDFARTARRIFEPKFMLDQPNMWLVEAGTGVGKTLGYLAPAAEWADRADGQVWVSTFTRALQKQIERDARALFVHPAEAETRIALRKGRENYLCLLNFQERLSQVPPGGRDQVLLVLLARWVVYSRDGDLIGGDFPGWIWGLFPVNGLGNGFGGGGLNPAGLIDRRGECIHAACAHYRRCFVEASIRRAQSADIVIANHALVMAQAAFDHHQRAREARDIDTEGHSLSRIVFDEGHHVFDAADSAFSTRLSGYEANELRRWIRGTEGSRRRSRGLEARLGELLAPYEAAHDAMKSVMAVAACLPPDGWSGRLFAVSRAGEPLAAAGPVEALLAAARDQIQLRQSGPQRRGTDAEQEVEAYTPTEAVRQAAAVALGGLEGLLKALNNLIHAIEAVAGLEDGPDPSERIRLDGALRGLRRRAAFTLPGWIGLVRDLSEAGESPDVVFVDRFSLDQIEGRGVDVALSRHFVDPGVPLAELVLKPAHGVLMASATLSDGRAPEPSTDGDIPEAEVLKQRFALALKRTGAGHLLMGAKTATIASPFDYGAQARLYVVSDVTRDDSRAVAAAMGDLFLAAGGGALGLFTAISRLKAAFAPLNERLTRAGIALYAQHVDPFEVSDLVSIFRAELHACLLGTDAVRDGVDVPGEALRLICFDRVPWPRPDLVHKARRQLFGRSYDDSLARARLTQAFGRLIRRKDDKGVFVMLDSAAPTRLFSALPEGVVIQRCTLAETVAAVSSFLKP